MIIRCKAPLRISFCGGGTDVSPYVEERGGVVLSATIDKYAYGNLVETDEPRIEVLSLDYDIVAQFESAHDLRYDGNLDLVKAVLRHMGLNQEGEFRKGLRLLLHSDAPPGSGLGSSSSLMVCLVALFAHWLQQPLSSYEVAQLAYKLERQELAIQGGMQDQYAATFGGLNLIEFTASGVLVNPLRPSSDILNELQYHLLLCYTGGVRLSARILERQIASYVEKKVDVVEALDELKALTYEMKNALLKGELTAFGHLLHHAWEHKKRLDPAITNSQIDALYEAARERGALGGKILGAGGGGYLLVYCPIDKKHEIAGALEAVGGRVVPFSFTEKGVETWRPWEQA